MEKGPRYVVEGENLMIVCVNGHKNPGWVEEKHNLSSIPHPWF